MPEALKMAHNIDWVEKCLQVNLLLGMVCQSNVEKILKEQKTYRVLAKLWEMQDVNEAEITLEVPKAGNRMELNNNNKSNC